MVAGDWKLECGRMQMRMRKLFGSDGKILKVGRGGGLPDFINALKIIELPCIAGELYGMQFTPQ